MSDMFVSDEEAQARRRSWETARRAGEALPWYAHYYPGSTEFVAHIDQMEPEHVDRILSRQLPKELARRRAERAAATPPVSRRSPERDAEREWRRLRSRAEREAIKLRRQASFSFDSGDEARMEELLLRAAQADREADDANRQVILWQRAQCDGGRDPELKHPPEP